MWGHQRDQKTALISNLLNPLPNLISLDTFLVQLGHFPFLDHNMASKIVTSSSGPDPNAIPESTAPHENDWYNQDFDGYRITEQPLFERRPIRLVCVGAGAAGLQIAYKAERLLKDVKLQIYEKNHDIGGTWLENRYPGCTCDIPSHS
jgi:hypothetical protein